jgi:elongation factor G
MGSASGDNGIRRLLKMLRHEVPDVSACVERLGLSKSNDSVVQVLKTYHTMHGGKMSVVRVLNGQIADSATFTTPEGEAGNSCLRQSSIQQRKRG